MESSCRDPGDCSKRLENMYVHGCAMFKVVSKLKRLKKDLKMLNGEQFSNIEHQADLVRRRCWQFRKPSIVILVIRICILRIGRPGINTTILTKLELAFCSKKSRMTGLEMVIQTLVIFMYI